MDAGELGKAALLAEGMSRFRHKKVRLIVTSAGIIVDGILIRPDGVEMQRLTTDLAWADLTPGAPALEAAIRDIDRRLTAEWTNMEPADDH